MSVTVASSGEEALAKLAHVRCDVALLDLHLPGISGLDLLARLKEQQPEMEVILLTANSSVETAVLAMKRGAYDYLPNSVEQFPQAEAFTTILKRAGFKKAEYIPMTFETSILYVATK